MTRPVNVDRISDQVIRDARKVTATGRLVGEWPTSTGRALVIHVEAGQEIEVHPQ